MEFKTAVYQDDHSPGKPGNLEKSGNSKVVREKSGGVKSAEI